MTATFSGVDDARRPEDDARAASSGVAQTLALFEMLFSTMPVGVAFVDRDFRFVHVNEMLAAVNGRTVAEHVGELVATVVPHLWSGLEPLYRRVIDCGEATLGIEFEAPSALRTPMRCAIG